ncbi:MAG: 30S ribosomal protein S6 [Christensenellaceae bacterium]|jgi:small subunit ribosomal protein S6|nr:30S ribosomal protein S6 [Christensenellaceae bacterium]
MKKKYCLLYIINNALSDDIKKATVDKFSALIESLGGEIHTNNVWGTRALAYPINHQKEGYYVEVRFSADATAPLEISRQLGINDAVVRNMITC